MKEKLGIQQGEGEKKGFRHRRGEKETGSKGEAGGDRERKCKRLQSGKMTPFSCRPRKINTKVWEEREKI